MNTRQKRAAVIGVGRPWYRNPHPSSMDTLQRAAVGMTYPYEYAALVIRDLNIEALHIRSPLALNSLRVTELLGREDITVDSPFDHRKVLVD